VIVRKQIGLALVVGGASLIAVAGSRYAVGAIKADRARQAWDQAAARAAVEASYAAVTYSAPRRVAEGAPMARLIIPRIDLDEIVIEGVRENDLDALPGHVPGTAIPGESGNSVISAHRDRHFNRFDQLKVGDTIVTETGRHKTMWVISSRKVLDKDAPALFRTSDATLTLTTCWPIRYLGSAPDRLIVTAKKVGAPAEVAPRSVALAERGEAIAR
jgi:LPXTG-site transpeptidase (sortase) family protein